MTIYNMDVSIKLCINNREEESPPVDRGQSMNELHVKLEPTTN